MPVRHVLYLANHLVLNPHSRVYAIRGGSPELQGWDAATVIAVRMYNLIAAVVQSFSKVKDPSVFIDWPGAEKHENVFQPKTLAELVSGPLDSFMNE